MQPRLAGRSAIITGGAGGIGGATAALFCRQGANVLIADTNHDALEEMARSIRSDNKSAVLELVTCDVANADDAQAAVARAIEMFGTIDILINNAAVRNLAPFAETATVEWHRLISVNLLGAVNCTKAALPELRKRGDASIVMVSSCYGVVGRAGMAIYDATKAALLSVTRSLAIEEAQNGIRVNAVCPGATLTPYTLERNMSSQRTEEEVRAERRTDSLLHRWAQPQEIAYPILWLASSEASFMTGATIMVDGGLSAM